MKNIFLIFIRILRYSLSETFLKCLNNFCHEISTSNCKFSVLSDENSASDCMQFSSKDFIVVV